MVKNANQRLVDALIRHQAFLVGHAKQLAEQLGKTLDETTPEMRKHLLETFASNDSSPTARKLRAAEAKLLGLRQPQWNIVREQLIDAIADLVTYEPDFLGRLVRRIRNDGHLLWATPVAGVLRGLVSKAFVAGRTIAEHIAAMARNDLARIAGATRIGYLARETAQQIATRVLGTARLLSPILRTTARALDTLVGTAVHAVSSAALERASAANAENFEELEIWLSILDARTTDTCRKLHEKVFRRGEGIRPGYHYYCRSIRVALLNDGGRPTNVESFETWVAEQGEKFRRWLRSTAAFTKDSVPPMSLDEVKQRDEDTSE